ncbi:hypothetical protein FNYG_12188 [Fusarium nygamai]|uniref:Ig-like domain-containing protein n=1 Tax=Gibberella nygamai TaxID=42673 RepID=A0A2K0VX24_GIBNY|nr:hypothetical protein FNYG_12188 [Fusarium nygamai]
MRSKMLLLAVGLLVADFALASPCKPRSSTSEISMSATVASTTAEGSSTVSVSETSIETGTTITTATSEVETTTVAGVTATTAEAESTTTTAVATPTFTIVGGGGAIQGAPLKGTDQDGSILLFIPQVGNSRTRTIILDPDTGRLRDKDTGILLCAYYGSANSPEDPANIALCQNGNTGLNMPYEYMTCQIASGKLTCTAPKGQCPTDDDGNFLGCTTESFSGENNQFYYKAQPGAGDYLFISSGSPAGYTAVDIIAQEA